MSKATSNVPFKLAHSWRKKTENCASLTLGWSTRCIAPGPGLGRGRAARDSVRIAGQRGGDFVAARVAHS